jgi:glutamine amidotransferase
MTANQSFNKGSVVIVDTGCANITSVFCAFERLGADVIISADVDTIRAASKVVIPGVGTAVQAMANIKAKGLLEILQQLTQPTLGICLGMQLMTELSLENPSLVNSENTDAANHHTDKNDTVVQCLGVIPGQVEPLKSNGLRLPHMGWNTLKKTREHAILAGIMDTDYVYFVHSFAVKPSSHTLASCEYGTEFSAIIGKANFIGMQFHPERSGAVGRQLLANFLAATPEELWV